MFLNIFSKRKPLRKPLRCFIVFKRIVWLLFMLIFALHSKKQGPDSFKISALIKIENENQQLPFI
jgi:hypothetical protein